MGSYRKGVLNLLKGKSAFFTEEIDAVCSFTLWSQFKDILVTNQTPGFPNFLMFQSDQIRLD